MKLKIGDTVEIATTSEYYGLTKDNPADTLGTITKIGDGDLDILVKWDNGTQNGYNEQDLTTDTTKTIHKMATKNIMKNAVKTTADTLLTANNTVTTLEIKNELRKKEPNFYWSQATISNIMSELEKEGAFTYVDNGTFRVYSDPAVKKPTARVKTVAPTTATTAPTGKGLVKGSAKALAAGAKAAATRAANAGKTGIASTRISRTKALQLMKNNKGHFFTAVFTKQDGSERTINAQYLKDQASSDLGYVKVREASKLKASPSDSTRQINIQTLKSLKIAGTQYTVR